MNAGKRRNFGLCLGIFIGGQRITMPKTTKFDEVCWCLKHPDSNRSGLEYDEQFPEQLKKCHWVVNLDDAEKIIQELEEENHRLTIGRDNWRKDIIRQAHQELWNEIELELIEMELQLGDELTELIIEQLEDKIQKKFNLK